MPEELNEDLTTPKGLRDHAAQLEEELKAAREQLAKTADIERQFAFVKAGVDVDSKQGSYFYKGYDGDLTVEAIKAEATELGLVGAPAPAEPEQQATPEERESTRERANLATGAGNDPQTEDPRVTALNSANAAIKRGARNEDAIGDAFADLAYAGYVENDQRVIWKSHE